MGKHFGKNIGFWVYKLPKRAFNLHERSQEPLGFLFLSLFD